MGLAGWLPARPGCARAMAACPNRVQQRTRFIRRRQNIVTLSAADRRTSRRGWSDDPERSVQVECHFRRCHGAERQDAANRQANASATITSVMPQARLPRKQDNDLALLID